MRNLELLEPDATDYTRLQAEAEEAAERVDIDRISVGREAVRGVLLLDQRLSQVGVATSTDTEDVRWLSLHLPHFEAIAPPRSPLDNLVRYAYSHQWQQGFGMARDVWRNFFSDKGGAFPTLTLSIPLGTDPEKPEIGHPFYDETIFTPTVVPDTAMAQALGKQKPQPQLDSQLRACADLAEQLALQRLNHGATEVYHDGKMWGPSPDTRKYRPIPRFHIMRRELLLTGAISLGRHLVAENEAAVYLAHKGGGPVSPAQVAEYVADRFEGHITDADLLASLRRARGKVYREYRPERAINNTAYHGPVAEIDSRWSRYTNVINARLATQWARADDTDLYTDDELAAYLQHSSQIIASNPRKVGQTKRPGAPPPRPTESG